MNKEKLIENEFKNVSGGCGKPKPEPYGIYKGKHCVNPNWGAKTAGNFDFCHWGAWVPGKDFCFNCHHYKRCMDEPEFRRRYNGCRHGYEGICD